ncbi:hypothetical protein CBOM_06898 [Ceraceosorus bombacis]|uniref:Uncharacterized protein n=1 Tax=Ceraceosorus bombacis TaxID=401625 RepID=A0A0P1BRL7_9BASI|nr:hypothetical protein CBOM_06898 [Ceraceosorus bombacis]
MRGQVVLYLGMGRGDSKSASPESWSSNASAAKSGGFQHGDANLPGGPPAKAQKGKGGAPKPRGPGLSDGAPGWRHG